VEATAFPRLVAAALAGLGTTSEDVLWSALFVLAVVARDSGEQFAAHLRVLAGAGVLPALERALAGYQAGADAQVRVAAGLLGQVVSAAAAAVTASVEQLLPCCQLSAVCWLGLVKPPANDGAKISHKHLDFCWLFASLLQGLEADQMILQAGEFLVAVLQRAPELAWLCRCQHLARLALIGLAALSVARWLRSRLAAK
jgi:hypothetical protein